MTKDSERKAPRVAVLDSQTKGSSRLSLTGVFLLCIAATACAGLGVVLDSPSTVAFATAVWAWGIASVHVTARQFSPLVVFSGFSGLGAIANWVGMLSAGGSNHEAFFIYADEYNLRRAMLIAFLSSVSICLGFVSLSAVFVRGGHGPIPSFNHAFRRWELLVLLPILGIAIAIGSRVGVESGGGVLTETLGSIWSIVANLPMMIVFVLASHGWRTRTLRSILVSLAVAGIASFASFLFAYLRSSAVIPIVAFVAGSIHGTRSLRPLRHWTMLPVAIAALLFATTFESMGEMRDDSRSIGLERAADLSRASARTSFTESATRLFARFTSLNQLTQVCRIADEDGFYHGATLEYMAFAFVPRFVWRDKPVIAKGGWFAERAGLAVDVGGGVYSNSVDMTIGGELYMNFGYPGTVLGGLVAGGFFSALWNTTQRNAGGEGLGTMFAAYLLVLAVNFGADLQVVVTAIATYLVLFALAVGLRRKRGRVATHD